MPSLSKLTTNALLWRFLDFVAVKVVFLVRLLVLARLLTPEDFGLLAIAVTAIAVMLNLSNIGIEPALIQRPDVTQEDYDAGWSIGIVRAMLVVLVIFPAAPYIASLFGDPAATEVIQVLTIGVIIDALGSIKIAGLNRDLKFRSLAIVNLAQAITTTIVAIVMATRYGVWALVAGSIAGSLSATVSSYIIAPYLPKFRWHKAATLNLLSYGRWIFFSGLIIMVATAGLRAIISRHLGVAELGIFYLAARLAYLPYEAIIGVVEPVAFPVYARLQEQAGKTRELFRTSLLGIATFLIPACLLLAALAPGLVEHVLGARWSGTTTAVQILALSSPLGLAAHSALPLLKGLGLPSRVTIYEIVKSGISLTLVWLLASRFGLPGAVTAILIAVAVSQPVCIVYTRKVLEHPYAGLWPSLLTITAASLSGAVVATILDSRISGIAGFLIAACAGGTMTLGLLLTVDRACSLGIAGILTRYFPVLTRLLPVKYSLRQGDIIRNKDK
jgi:teichuronic acid exporter